MGSNLEDAILAIERAYLAIPDLTKRIVAAEQSLAMWWASLGYGTPPITCSATYSGTLLDCAGAGWVGQTITVKNAGGGTLGTATTGVGGVFTGSVTITDPSQAVTFNTSGITGYADSSLPITLSCGSNSIGNFSPTWTINHIPTLNSLAGAAVNICGSSGATTVNLTGIGDGDGGTQNLTVTATSTNTAFIPNPTVTYTSPNTTGSIVWTPNAGVFGSATISVTVTDDGGTSCGGVNKKTQTFSVTNTQQCGPPTLDALSNATVAHGSGAHTVNLTGIGFGPNVGCSGTVLTVNASSTNPGLIPNPTVTYTSAGATGSISYSDLGGTGTATITVTVSSNIAVFGFCRTATFSRTFVVTVT